MKLEFKLENNVLLILEILLCRIASFPHLTLAYNLLCSRAQEAGLF